MEVTLRGMVTNVEGITDWGKTELKALKLTYRILQPEELEGKIGTFMLPMTIAPPSVGSMVTIAVVEDYGEEE